MTQYSKKSTGVRKMADGGSVGLFERLAAGNIDDPKSEAYKRWGAGSKQEAAPSAPAPAPSAPVGNTAREDSAMSEANASPDSSRASEDASESTREARRSTPASAPAKPAKPRQIVKPAPSKASPAPPPAAAPKAAPIVTPAKTRPEPKADYGSDSGGFYETASRHDPLSLKNIGAALTSNRDSYDQKRKELLSSHPRKGMANGGVVGTGGAKAYGKKG